VKRQICARKNEAGVSDLHILHITTISINRRFAAGGGVGLGWRLGLALVVGLGACGLGSFGTRGQGRGLVAFLHLRFLLCLLLGERGERGGDVTFRLE